MKHSRNFLPIIVAANNLGYEESWIFDKRSRLWVDIYHSMMTDTYLGFMSTLKTRGYSFSAGLSWHPMLLSSTMHGVLNIITLPLRKHRHQWHLYHLLYLSLFLPLVYIWQTKKPTRYEPPYSSPTGSILSRMNNIRNANSLTRNVATMEVGEGSRTMSNSIETLCPEQPSELCKQAKYSQYLVHWYLDWNEIANILWAASSNVLSLYFDDVFPLRSNLW